MKKFDKFLLINYISIFILIFILGMSGVFADTLENIGYLNENSEVLVDVSYTGYPLPLQRTDTYQLEQVEALNIHISNFTFSSGTTYSLELSTPNTALSYANAFTVTGYDSNNNSISCATVGITYDDIKYLNFKFNCSSTVDDLYLRIFNSSNDYIMDPGIFSWSYVYLRRVTSSLDTSILESQNSQIIQGQEEIKDTIKNELNSCRDSVNLLPQLPTGTLQGLNFTALSNGYTHIKGTSIDSLRYIYLTDISLSPGTYTFSVDVIGSVPYGSSQVLLVSNNVTISTINLWNPNPQTIIITENTNISYYFFYSNANFTYDIQLGIQLQKGSFATTFEKPGEICQNKIDETNNQLGDLNNSLNNSNSSGATNDASNFFSNFTTDTFGLTSIITAPLNIINSITSTSCTSLNLPLPYLDNEYLPLPCMDTIYSNYFGVFFSLYQTITFGIVSYWVIVRIFNQVKDFKNPEHDEIEVLDL